MSEPVDLRPPEDHAKILEGLAIKGVKVEALQGGGGGGISGGMDQRVIRLEEWARTSDARMGRVEDKLDTVIERLGRLPSRLDMLGYLIATVAAFLALTAVIVTSMGWLETRAARVSGTATPVIVQLPAPPSAPPSRLR